MHARALALGLTLAIDLGGGLCALAVLNHPPQNWVVSNSPQNWAVLAAKIFFLAYAHARTLALTTLNPKSMLPAMERIS